MKSKTTTVHASRGLAAAAVLGVLAFAAGCGSVPGQAAGDTGRAVTGQNGAVGAADKGAAPAPESTPTPDPVVLTPNVDKDASGVEVDSIVKVAAANGTLSKVSVSYKGTTRQGKSVSGKVDGALNDAKTGWTADERLEPASTYTIKMTGANPQGTATTTTSTFSTEKLTSDEETYPTVFPQKGTTVGVGMPVILTFDRPVSDQKNFEKHLSVSTSPKQAGTWHWISSTEVHYRPKTYWKAGTKVSVTGDLNGLSAGNGIYGQNSISTSFTIGRSQITKIDLGSDVAKVYRDGKVVRTIYVSGGKDGWQSRSGIKLIMSKETNKKMTNEMIGAKEDYDLNIAYALRITNSGEFLHSAPWNTAYFGKANTSHGCTGMSTSDAKWLYDHSLIGDPTDTTGTSRGMEEVNGWSDWNISWSQYQKGSAL